MSPADPRFPLLLVCGPSGTGKSSVAWEVYWTLGRAGVPVAHLDLDSVGYGPPPSAFGTWDMKIINAAALWKNYRTAGARCFVISGLPALREQIDKSIRSLAGAIPTVCVLMVSPEEQSERILRRARGLYALEHGGASSAQTPEALAQTTAAAARELTDEVELIPGSLVIDTVGFTVTAIAELLIEQTGWPNA
ncbi:MAG TPA: hypothetical protein VFM96_06160 [Gaiellaceae bacterium]|nr:hypothetical protein [Gaiellaceae bacterium]